MQGSGFNSDHHKKKKDKKENEEIFHLYGEWLLVNEKHILKVLKNQF